MSKIARYLQEHLEGEVTSSLEARRYFSTDRSVLRILPAVVAYPASQEDVRKICRFSWQLAEKGHKLPITARGGGSDTSGAAIGSGIVAVFGPHLNRILSLDARHGQVVVEPGLGASTLQQTLYTHGQFLPSVPPKTNSTIGGAIANNASSEKSVKYGATANYIDKLSVVLANGESIEAGPLNKQGLSLKLGQSNFEGEIYRQLDTLLEENADVIAHSRQKFDHLPRNVAGLNIFDVASGGSFNLVPLLAGSQGTLGIITQAHLKLELHNPAVGMALVSLGRSSRLEKLLPQICQLGPSDCELLTRGVLEEIAAIVPGYLGKILDQSQAAVYVLVEFNDKHATKSLEALHGLVEEVGGDCRTTNSLEEENSLRHLFAATANLSLRTSSRKAYLPAADVAVPVENLAGLIGKLTQLGKEADVAPNITGHAGEGIISIHPALDLSNLGDRQKLFKLTTAAYDMAIAAGGTPSAGSGDGRLRTAKLEKMYGKKIYTLMVAVKKIFDPHDILNPGVKFGTTEREVKMLLNSTYSPHNRYETLSF